MSFLRVYISPQPREQGRLIREVIQSSIVVESILGQIVDTCEFIIHDRHRTVTVRSMTDIVVTLEETDTAPDSDPTWNGGASEDNVDARRIFAGLVAYIVGEPEGIERLWHVSCQDYTILLDRTLVLQNYVVGYTYTNSQGSFVGDRAIIGAALERDSMGEGGGSTGSEIRFDPSLIEQGLDNVSQQLFKYSTLREVVSQLSQYVGFDFYVDYHKRLHYYYREDAANPLVLTDIPVNRNDPADDDLVNYQKASWKRDGTRLVNTFALFGDRLLSDNLTEALPYVGGDEYDLGFEAIRINFVLLPEPQQSAIRIDYNAGNKSLSGTVHDGVDGVGVLSVIGADFVADGVVIGDVLLNETDGSWGGVTSVSATLIVAPLRGGTRNSWNVGDTAAVPNWTARAVVNDVIRGIGTADILHDALGKKLTFAVTPPIGPYAMRVRFTHNFVGGQVDSDSLSVSRYGRVLARRVIASDVNSAQGILQKLEHLKEQYSDALEVVILDLHDRAFPDARRYRSGEWLDFTNNILGVMNKELLVHRITTRILGVGEEENQMGGVVRSGHLHYELEMRDWETDII